ncbi:MAG TPA: peptide chain release factor N(5)-glutamine methyltransferase [Clostridiales bacterium]|nr:peptide chain release factor N(5)-glutamine methyltransferase [Clostridiales bacterium]
MNIRSALSTGTKILKSVGNQSPAADAGVILCFLLNCDKTFLFSHDDYELTEEEQETFKKLIGKRSEGVPLQHITGRREFMSLDFIVNSHVLIPRQETEMLVEYVIKYINNLTYKYTIKPEMFNILDIGTGSGCIAVSLAHYVKNCGITAVDISEEALNTARLNAVKNGVEDRINFILSDLFNEVAGNLYDVIVSNPPYIAKKEIETLQVEVREHEPIIALDGGVDGFDFYTRITEEAPLFLKVGGILAVEVGYNQAGRVADLMRVCNFRKIEIIKDLDGIDRVVIGQI